MKSVNDWKTQQELEPKARWLPRWKEEETQTLRFLSEPSVLKLHAGKMFTLACQAEFSTEDRLGDATVECRLCKEGKPPREAGVAVVEKDADGLPRLFPAGMEKFWVPFLKEHQDDYQNQAFKISYHHDARKYSFVPITGSGESVTFVGPDYLEGAMRQLASDETYDRYQIKFPWPDFRREQRATVLRGDADAEGGDADREKGESYVMIDDPEV